MNHRLKQAATRCLVVALLPVCALPKDGKVDRLNEIQATASQRVHPVLIGNELNALAQVVVEVGWLDVHAI